VEEPGVQTETTNLPQVTDKLCNVTDKVVSHVTDKFVYQVTDKVVAHVTDKVISSIMTCDCKFWHMAEEFPHDACVNCFACDASLNFQFYFYVCLFVW